MMSSRAENSIVSNQPDFALRADQAGLAPPDYVCFGHPARNLHRDSHRLAHPRPIETKFKGALVISKRKRLVRAGDSLVQGAIDKVQNRFESRIEIVVFVGLEAWRNHFLPNDRQLSRHGTERKIDSQWMGDTDLQ